MRVWIEEWQFACCGTPFAVGSVVEWTVVPVADVASLSRVTDDDTARSIDACEERHGGDPDEPEDLSTVTGVVRSIWASYHRPTPATPRSGKYRPVSEPNRLVPLPDTYGDDPDIDGMNFCGYIVDLDTW